MAVVGELIYSTAAQWFLEQIFDEVKGYIGKKLKNLGEEQDSTSLRNLGDFLESDRVHFDDKLKEYELNKLKNARLHLKMALTPLEEEMLKNDENFLSDHEDNQYGDPEKLIDALNAIRTNENNAICDGWLCSDRRDAFKKEIDNAYYWSMDAFTTINNDLGAKMQALKILLFCSACIHKKDWPKQWNILLSDEFLKRRDVQKTWNEVRKLKTEHNHCMPWFKLPKFLLSGTDKKLIMQEQLFRLFMNVNRVLDKIGVAPPEIIEITEQPTATPELFDALSEGSAKGVRALLSNNRNANGVDDIGRTPLVYAIEVNAPIQCIQDVIRSGADIHSEVLGHPPLFWTVVYENRRAADELLKHTRADTWNSHGYTVLHFSARLGRSKMIKWFVEMKRVDINMTDRRKRTPLCTAVDYRNKSAVRVVLECGGNAGKSRLGDVDLSYMELCNAVGLSGNSKMLPLLFQCSQFQSGSTSHSGYNALHVASYGGNVSLINILIAKGVDVMGKNYRGETPLHVAAERGNKEALEVLLEWYKAADRCTDEGISGVLHEQPEETDKNSDVVSEEPVSEKDDTFLTNSGETLLHYAAKSYTMAPNTYLHESGFDINRDDSGGIKPLDTNACYGDATLTHCAPKDNYIDTIAYLLENSFDINKEDSRGRTPLDVAAYHGDANVVEGLLKFGAKIGTDKEGYNALHHAARGFLDNDAVIQLLYDNGFDVNSRTNNGLTPLHLAVRCENDAIIRKLLDLDATVNATDLEGNSALHCICNCASVPYCHFKFVETLLDRGADPNMKNKSDCVPLHYAAKNSSLYDIEALLENGADLHAVDMKGQNALHYATFYEDYMCNRTTPMTIELLIVKGLEVNSRTNNGSTPLLEAARQSNAKAIKKLKASGADLAAVDKDGNNALHYVALASKTLMWPCERYVKTIKLLIDYGLDVNTGNKILSTPLHEIARHGRVNAVKELIALGANPQLINKEGKKPVDYSVDQEIIDLLEEYVPATSSTELAPS